MSSRPINYAASFIVTNFILAHIVFSDRVLKGIYKIDHNASPRQDLDKYGAEAVRKGKIDQATLEMLKRSEGAHKNALDHFPMFIGTMVCSLLTKNLGLSTAP